MLIAFALAVLPWQGGPRGSMRPGESRRHAVPLPNYAETMTSPKEDVEIVPRLVPARGTFPIRIGIKEKPDMMTPGRQAIMIAACAKWAYATRSLSPGLRFKFVTYRKDGDVDILFTYRGMGPNSTLKGLTFEHGDWASIEIAVEDANQVPLPDREILRVATHEVGHALGIWGHSPNPQDAMSVSGDAFEITRSDVNTLRIAYGAY